MKDLTKRKAIRSKAITKAAEGEQCAVCGKNDGTTVYAHLNESFAGKSLGKKADDLAGFFACFECHHGYDGWIDGNYAITYFDVLRAVYRTWRRLYELGIIQIKGAE